MEFDSYREPKTKGAIDLFILLNMIAILLEFAAGGYFFFAYPDTYGIFALHFFITAPSLMYHCMPVVRYNCLFRLLAWMVSLLTILPLLLNVAILLSGEMDKLGVMMFLFIMILYTLPPGLVAITLLFILWTDKVPIQDSEDAGYEKLIDHEPQNNMPRAYP